MSTHVPVFFSNVSNFRIILLWPKAKGLRCLANRREVAGSTLRWINISGFSYSLYNCAMVWSPTESFFGTICKKIEQLLGSGFQTSIYILVIKCYHICFRHNYRYAYIRGNNITFLQCELVIKCSKINLFFLQRKTRKRNIYKI